MRSFLSIFLITVSFFQIFYIVNIIVFYFLIKKRLTKSKKTNKRISVIIPLFNSEKTISHCLDSILKNDLSLIKKIVIVLDHCSDRSAMAASVYIGKFQKTGIRFQITSLNNKKRGKVDAIKHGFKFIKTKDVLLLDADIILKNDAVEKLLHFHSQDNNLYSSCLVYPYQQQINKKLILRIIYQDRLYRQNILKIVRDRYNVANFPGSIGIVNIENYNKFLFSGFLEDLVASFRIISAQNKIAILPMVIAYEIERQSFKGLFFQRIRWSVGNIENISLLARTIFFEKNVFKKILIISYPIMWYVQHYAIAIGIITAIFSSFKLFALIPLFLYLVQILLSAWIGRGDYSSTVLEIIGHCIIFPFIITAALMGAVVMIIINKKFYFKKKFLFNRI